MPMQLLRQKGSFIMRDNEGCGCTSITRDDWHEARRDKMRDAAREARDLDDAMDDDVARDEGEWRAYDSHNDEIREGV